MYDTRAVESYIRQAAQARGINPDIAVRVARSEGLASGVWQSNLGKSGRREPSYGPFQLLVGGGDTGFPTGMGNAFIKATGKHPSDPSTVYQQVDFALDNAAQGGWSPWYGAAKVGVSKWDGLQNARATGVTAQPVGPLPSSPAGGSRAAAEEQPVFGSFAPAGADVSPPTMPSIDPSAAALAFQKPQPTMGDRIGGALGALELMPAARISRPLQGPSDGQANALLKFLNSPTAADMLMKRRLAGV